MLIRLAQGEDLPAINEIYNQAVNERFCTAHLSPVDMDYTSDWFVSHSSDRFPVYVSVDLNKVTGWVSLGPYRSGRQALAHVGEVSYYVDRESRGKGTGSLLLQHALSTAPACGLSILVAILLSENPASIALLEKFGFSLWGSMPGIAKIGTEAADHLYMGLKL
ncbi:MAG: N-acetyltransferase [Bacteroidetes bacterium]|nr:N-acetyltransferase [Bacteroidota bacterium]